MRIRPLVVFAFNLAAIALVAFGLAGCGQKGPLVLPKSQAASASSFR
jgi:predicted small lipoprotein YifL